MNLSIGSNTTPLGVETRALELALRQLEHSIGVSMENDNVTPDGIWQTLKALFFSIPMSPNAAAMSEQEKDAQLAEYFGVSKTAFLTRTQIRLTAVRRRSARKRITGK